MLSDINKIKDKVVKSKIKKDKINQVFIRLDM